MAGSLTRSWPTRPCRMATTCSRLPAMRLLMQQHMLPACITACKCHTMAAQCRQVCKHVLICLTPLPPGVASWHVMQRLGMLLPSVPSVYLSTLQERLTCRSIHQVLASVRTPHQPPRYTCSCQPTMELPQCARPSAFLCILPSRVLN